MNPVRRCCAVFAVALAWWSSALAADPADPLEGVGKLELIRGGFKKLDTPEWLPQSQLLLATDLDTGEIHQLDPEGNWSVVAENAGRLLARPDGSLLAVMDGALKTWKPGGPGKTVLEKAAGGREISLNDMVAANDRLYFTTLKDPEKGRLSVADLATGEVRVLFDGEQEPGLWNPNGVALSPDGKHLYVGISSYKNRKTSGVYRFAVTDDGGIDLAAGKAERWAPVKAPDGIAVDPAGNVYFTAGGKVVVYSPDGKQWGTIKIPKGSGTNLAFGGPSKKTLYVSTWDALYAVELPALRAAE